MIITSLHFYAIIYSNYLWNPMVSLCHKLMRKYFTERQLGWKCLCICVVLKLILWNRIWNLFFNYPNKIVFKKQRNRTLFWHHERLNCFNIIIFDYKKLNDPIEKFGKLRTLKLFHPWYNLLQLSFCIKPLSFRVNSLPEI